MKEQVKKEMKRWRREGQRGKGIKKLKGNIKPCVK